MCPPGIGDDDQRGHGTPVSGIAIYGDVRQQLPPNGFQQRFKLASAKLVDAGKFDPSLTVAQAMDIAIRKLHDEFGCTVINISLADPNRRVGAKPSAVGCYPGRVGQRLDLVIVVAAGNREKFTHIGEAIIAAYPKCLLEDANRILEPASAINVVTVGSLAHSNGIAEQDEEYVGVLPVTELDHPSPFTRVGPGVSKIIQTRFCRLRRHFRLRWPDAKSPGRQDQGGSGRSVASQPIPHQAAEFGVRYLLRQSPGCIQGRSFAGGVSRCVRELGPRIDGQCRLRT